MNQIENPDLFSRNKKDEWIWKKNDTGRFSVKSAYESMMQQTQNLGSFNWLKV